MRQCPHRLSLVQDWEFFDDGKKPGLVARESGKSIELDVGQTHTLLSVAFLKCARSCGGPCADGLPDARSRLTGWRVRLCGRRRLCSQRLQKGAWRGGCGVCPGLRVQQGAAGRLLG